MMKYQVVIKNSIDELEVEVNELLSEGWRPQGGNLYDGSTKLCKAS